MPDWKASKLTSGRLLFLAQFYLSLVLISRAICSQIFLKEDWCIKSLSRRLFSSGWGLSFHWPPPPGFTSPPLSLPYSWHITDPSGGPTPAPPLPFASPGMLPYTFQVANCWSSSSHIILFILCGLGSHHWPTCKEVWGRFSCSLRVHSEGRAAGVAQAAGTATCRDDMGHIPYSPHFSMSRDLKPPYMSKLQRLFSLWK